jgi:hypothetical protein
MAAASKASVKIGDVDLSSVFEPTKP